MTTTSAKLLAPSLRRMPARSRRSLSCSARRRLSAATWTLAALALIGLLTLAGCASPAPAVISADRTITPLPDGRYAVTGTWLVERYELERALRLRIEQCEGKKNL